MRILILLGFAAALTLGGCDQGQQDQVAQQPGEREASKQQTAAREQPAADREQQAAQEQQAMTQDQQREGGQESTGQQATEQQEYLGQSPAFGDAPETVVLEASMGKVTLPHKAHAEKMECQECHEGTPGKMADFGKDEAHELCKGCHQEQGAGPTKCSECHKK